MHAPYHHQDHLISLSRFDQAIENIIRRCVTAINPEHQLSLLPTIIGIRIAYCPPHHSGLMLEFLRRLVKHPSAHFVRFACSPDWVIRANAVMHYYTDCHDLSQTSDILWTVSVTGTSQIGINATLSTTRADQVYLHGLSHQLSKSVWSLNRSDDSLCYMMKHMTQHASLLHHAREYLSQFHLLMIPKRDERSFMFAPIRAMTHEDGYYRHHYFKEQLRYQDYHYSHILRDHFSLSDHLCNLIDLIRDNELYGKDVHATKDVYALAELLYSIYLDDHYTKPLTHDAILFNITNEVLQDLKNYRLSFSDMHKSDA